MREFWHQYENSEDMKICVLWRFKSISMYKIVVLHYIDKVSVSRKLTVVQFTYQMSQCRPGGAFQTSALKYFSCLGPPPLVYSNSQAQGSIQAWRNWLTFEKGMWQEIDFGYDVSLRLLDTHYFLNRFWPRVRFPFIQRDFLQWSCNVSVSAWKLPDSNPGPLSHRYGALPVSHHISWRWRWSGGWSKFFLSLKIAIIS